MSFLVDAIWKSGRQACAKQNYAGLIAPLDDRKHHWRGCRVLTTSVTLSVKDHHRRPSGSSKRRPAGMAGLWRNVCGTRDSPPQQIEAQTQGLPVAWRWKSPDHAIKDGNPKTVRREPMNDAADGPAAHPSTQ